MKFGTDGIRGVPGRDYTLADLVQLGASVAQLLKGKKPGPCLIGQDTRSSSEALSLALATGLVAEGWHVFLAGVVPTPAISLLCATSSIPLGVMVSASHNPPEDNGIKLFQEDGSKWEPAQERKLEQLLERRIFHVSFLDGAVQDFRDAARRAYIQHFCTYFPDLACSQPLVFDCAEGAVSAVIDSLLQEFKFQATLLANQGEGRKINVTSGSLHPEKMAACVRKTGACAGFAFDGDGDRVVVSNEKGELLDGDQILALLALFFLEKGKLPRKEIVVTVMSNQGLVLFLKRKGIAVRRTPVGDRFVLRALRRHQLALGGEQAGHIIFPEVNASSDGLFTALMILSILQETKTSLSEWSHLFDPFPQKVKGYKVEAKEQVMRDEQLLKLTKEAKKKVGKWGRVLVRASGTEPKIRVMIEAEKKELLSSLFAEFDAFFGV